jgi:hypothetical protein
MATIKLGDRPKNFKKVIRFPLLDGTEGTIEVVFKYRTRKEFGAFIDSIMEAAKVTPKPADDGVEPVFSMQDLMERTAGSNADYILQVAESWNLDVEFSAAAVQQLSDELPGAALAIMEAYRVAITEGRVKN